VSPCFWVILCPISFVGKLRDMVGDMAKGLTARGGMQQQAARAADITILSKPVREGVLFECLTALHAEGVFRTVDSDDVRDAMPPLLVDLERQGRQDHSTPSSPAAVAGGAHSPGGVESRHPLSVLLVDDNSASQQATRRIIINAGMLCDVAGDGKQALAAMERWSPFYHIVLMHLTMADTSTATRLLRVAEKEQGLRRLPVIGVSATLSDTAVCIAAGLNACIQDPIREAELLEMIGTFAEHYDHGTDVEGGDPATHAATRTSSGSAMWDSVGDTSPAVSRRRGPVRDSVTSRSSTTSLADEPPAVSVSRGALRDSVSSTGDRRSSAVFKGSLAADCQAKQTAMSRQPLSAPGADASAVRDESGAMQKLVHDMASFDIDTPIVGGVAYGPRRRSTFNSDGSSAGPVGQQQPSSAMALEVSAAGIQSFWACGAAGDAGDCTREAPGPAPGQGPGPVPGQGPCCGGAGAGGPGGGGPGPVVLLVAHNGTERLLLKHMCQLEGCQVHTAETGRVALELVAANAHVYALCLIDTVLPDIEPLSLCVQILGRGLHSSTLQLNLSAFRVTWGAVRDCFGGV